MAGRRVVRKRGKDVNITLDGSDMEPKAVSVGGSIRREYVEKLHDKARTATKNWLYATSTLCRQQEQEEDST